MITKFCKLEMEHPAVALGGREEVTFFRDENSEDIYYSEIPASFYNPGDCEDITNLTNLSEGNQNIQKVWNEFAQKEVNF